MSITGIVEALVAAGATPEMILAAVRAAEASQVNALVQRRANDAERQRRKRERHVTSRDVTVTERDLPTPLVPPSFLPPTPPNQTPPYNPPTYKNPPSPSAQTPKGSTSRGCRLSDDFGLTADLLAYAAGKGLTEAHAGECLSEMREWAAANANRPVARKADWEATLKGWMRRKAQDLARAGPRRVENRAASFWGSNLSKAAE